MVELLHRRAMLERKQLFINPLRQSTPALFLDRDGVMIEDRHHLSDPEQVVLCKGVRNVIHVAVVNDWPVVVITNQSGIARGLFSWSHVDQVNKRMQDLLGAKAPLAGIYANGHGPDAPASSWRKPSPQMLLDAGDELNLDLQRSLLIGDRLSDLQAGAAAGVAKVFHVLSGHGGSARESVLDWHRQLGTNPSAPHIPALGLLESLELFPLSMLMPGNATPR
jgi:D-glycero-D-manno-heptose 1,7-bisphosphate phosphatase